MYVVSDVKEKDAVERRKISINAPYRKFVVSIVCEFGDWNRLRSVQGQSYERESSSLM